MLSFGLEEDPMDEKELKEMMLEQNPEFRLLHAEHQTFEKKLEALKAKSILTDEEKVEEREMKKHKLALKDRMYQMMNEFRKTL